jgi:hypothetical protein
MLKAQRAAERATAKVISLREELRDLALSLGTGFMEVFETGTVTLAWRGEGRPVVFVHLVCDSC